MMRLSDLALALILACAVPSAFAQADRSVPKLGYLGFQGEPVEGSPLRDAFVRGLRELGYVPGKNIVVDVRTYATEAQLRQVLTELVRSKTDVIFVGPPFAAMAAKQATRSIPIVCGSCGDPVENGLAASLARPGGNVTGLASLSAELIGKRMELLKDLFPRISLVAVFVFPANPGTPATLRALDTHRRALGIDVRQLEIRAAADFESAFQSAVAARAEAVILQDDPLTRPNSGRIAELSLKYRLPVSTGLVEVMQAGALMSYGPDRVEMTRRAATFVDKILKGAKPADLPFEQAAKLQLMLNVRSAKALGVTIPSSFLARVDSVIQ